MNTITIKVIGAAGVAIEKEVSIDMIVRDYTAFYKQPNDIDEEEVVLSIKGDSLMVEWVSLSQGKDDFSFMSAERKDKGSRGQVIYSSTFFRLKDQDQLLVDLVKEMSSLNVFGSTEAAALLEDIGMKVSRLSEISKAKDFAVPTAEDLVKLLKENEDLDFTDVRIEGKYIVFWLSDPGETEDWEQSEGSDHEEEEELSVKATSRIESEIKDLSTQFVKVELGEDYHLADVKGTILCKN